MLCRRARVDLWSRPTEAVVGIDQTPVVNLGRVIVDAETFDAFGMPRVAEVIEFLTKHALLKTEKGHQGCSMAHFPSSR